LFWLSWKAVNNLQVHGCEVSSDAELYNATFVPDSNFNERLLICFVHNYYRKNTIISCLHAAYWLLPEWRPLATNTLKDFKAAVTEIPEPGAQYYYGGGVKIKNGLP